VDESLATKVDLSNRRPHARLGQRCQPTSVKGMPSPRLGSLHIAVSSVVLNLVFVGAIVAWPDTLHICPHGQRARRNSDREEDIMKK